jgi:hypothetical protein
MIDPTHLRCVTALVQAVPGAQLVLHTRSGTAVTVGHHPSSDLSSCSLRRTLMAHTLDGSAAVCERLERAEVGGSMRAIGAGLHLASPGATVWFATSLVSAAVLREIELATSDEHGLVGDADVRLLGDEGLGVTLVEVASDQVDPIEVAMALAGRLLLIELDQSSARVRWP